MKEKKEIKVYLINLILFFLILILILTLILLESNGYLYLKRLIKIENNQKIAFFFFLILPILIFYSLIKHYYLKETKYFFEYICHFSTYILFGFPLILISFLTDFLFNFEKKGKVIFYILSSLLSILIIDILIINLKDYGFIISIFVLLIYSLSINFINRINFEKIYDMTLYIISIFIYNLYIIGFAFLYIKKYINQIHFYLLFFPFFVLLFIIHLLNLYSDFKYKREIDIKQFQEKLLDITFNSVLNKDLDRFFLDISNLLKSYVNYDLIFIGISNRKLSELNVIFSREKEKILEKQNIELKNSMTLIVLKTKNDFLVFEDISKIPDTMYKSLKGSNIISKSFIGIPLKDRYKRTFGVLGIERELKGKFVKTEIELINIASKNIQFVINNSLLYIE